MQVPRGPARKLKITKIDVGLKVSCPHARDRGARGGPTRAGCRLARVGGRTRRARPGGQRHGLPDGGQRHGLPELIAERRAKAERIAASDPSAFPHAFPAAEPIAQVLAAYQRLQAGEETDERHRVAGRLAARRGSGKAAFLDLVDRSGKIQLHARWTCSARSA